jgi:acylpyruvate hydrolase
MRLITFDINGQTPQKSRDAARWGALKNGHAVDLNLAHAMFLASRSREPQYLARDVLEFLQRGESAWNAARATLEFLGERVVDGVVYPLEQVKLRAPIARPPKIVAIGRNYAEHAAEDNVPPPKLPILFAKYSSSVIGPYDVIHVLPQETQQVDYEAELGVVIGKSARDVTAVDAQSYIFGYTVVNDVSARDIQLGPDVGGQWVRGKSFDTFCPFGPTIVSADEVADPQVLPIRSILKGKVMQDSNTKNMIFNVARLIEFISHGITLEPGDLIATGTPSGVGHYQKPPVYLRAGDVIEIEIPGIGKLRNPVED